MLIKRFILLLLALPTLSMAAPKIEHWTLANGARVYFVESHELPIVRAQFVFDAGSARDEAGKGGLALLANHLLDEGTATLDGEAVAQQLEAVGAELSSDVERDMAMMSLRSLSDSRRLGPAVEIMAALVRAPAFPMRAFERERQRLLVALAREEQSPASISMRAFYHAVYGGHPYAHSTNGDERSIKALQRADLIAFHRQHYVGNNAILVIVGDLSRAEAEKLAQKLAGELPAGERATGLDAPKAIRAARVHKAFPSTQTHILIGMPGMRRGDPDYFALYVGNYILGGGGLVSRLSNEVREKRGLAYSAYSYFYPLRVEGPFVLGLQTRNGMAATALGIAHETLRRFVDKGPGEDELVAAKKHLTGSYPLRLDNSGKIAGYLAMIAFYGLPLDYLDRFNAQIEAVTLEQIRDAFRRRIDPARLVVVTVGGARP